MTSTIKRFPSRIVTSAAIALCALFVSVGASRRRAEAAR